MRRACAASDLFGLSVLAVLIVSAVLISSTFGSGCTKSHESGTSLVID
jgi:hypothetical protein